MARALRELFAEFRVEFDRRRELRSGQQAITRTRGMMERATAGAQRLRGAAAQMGIALGGTAMVAGLGRMVSGVMAVGDELDKVSDQVGLTVQQFQAYQHAAGLSGVSSNDFANSMARLTKNARDTAQGAGEYADSFEALGVSVTDANGELLHGDELLRRVADGIAATENPAERTAIAMEIMGRSGRQMVPMLSGGSEALAEMEGELEELGGGMSDVAVENSVKLTDAVARLKLGMRSMGGAIAEKVFPPLERLVGGITEAATAFSEMEDKGRVLKGVLIAVGSLIAGTVVATVGIWGPVVLAAAAIALLYIAFNDLYKAMTGQQSVTEELLNSFGSLFDKVEFGTNLLSGLRSGWARFWDLLDRGISTSDALSATLDRLWSRGTAGSQVATVLLATVLGAYNGVIQLYDGVVQLGEGLVWLWEQLTRIPDAIQAVDRALSGAGSAALQWLGVGEESAEQLMGRGPEGRTDGQGAETRDTETRRPVSVPQGFLDKVPTTPPGNVDARMDVNVNISETTDSDRVRREVEDAARNVQEQQIRNMRGAHVEGA